MEINLHLFSFERGMIRYIKKDLSSLFNIGDSLCTPDVYFNIESDRDVRVIGGGVWDIRKFGTDTNAKSTVLWAAGESVKGAVPSMIDSAQLKYLEWSSRDRDLLINKSKFVPCVSCFHGDIISTAKGSNSLIFVNANTLVSDIPQFKDKTPVLTNANSYDDFIKVWKYSDTIVTNSYHGIYWSLLSGRNVAPFGYSSKFISLMKIFDLELPQDQMYKISNKSTLSQMLSSPKKKFFMLKDPTDRTREFQDINMNFIEKLKEHGIKCKRKQ